MRGVFSTTIWQSPRHLSSSSCCPCKLAMCTKCNNAPGWRCGFMEALKEDWRGAWLLAYRLHES
eukprot:95958-Chlamydomonas_euryale.AAC.1